MDILVIVSAQLLNLNHGQHKIDTDGMPYVEYFSPSHIIEQDVF